MSTVLKGVPCFKRRLKGITEVRVLIYTMKEQLKSWNRETTLAFVSMMVASYAWIVMEKFLVAVAIGIAMHAIQVLVYEFLARRFGWEQLEIAQAFHKHVFPRFVRLFSKTQR